MKIKLIIKNWKLDVVIEQKETVISGLSGRERKTAKINDFFVPALTVRISDLFVSMLNSLSLCLNCNSVIITAGKEFFNSFVVLRGERKLIKISCEQGQSSVNIA